MSEHIDDVEWLKENSPEIDPKMDEDEWKDTVLLPWQIKTGRVLYLVKTSTSFKTYAKLTEAVENWNNLAEIVKNNDKISRLIHHAIHGWVVGETPLRDVAVAILENMEKE